VPFSFIAAFQARHVDIAQSFIFAMVTTFMLLTSFFASNYVAEQTFRRMRLIMGAYTFIAVLSAVIAILAYLQLIPNAEYFLRYGRAKAMFKDPNVYGPFLILPAMYALQRLLLGTNARRAMFAALVFCALFMGVFASFSRAAWGNFAAAILIVFFLCFILEAHARDKVRMLLMALGGGMVMIVLLLGALSIPAVNSLFEVRASATQNYDTGESGRFGRQGYAYELALAHPWGLGPMEFQSLRIIEAPHNTYVTIIHHNGWGGALCYAALIILTLYRAIRGLAQKQNRLLLIPLVAVYIPLVIQAAIIDIDHWRHYFLVVGLIWGVTAVRPTPSVRISRNEALL
jgi:O-antigen ligase